MMKSPCPHVQFACDKPAEVTELDASPSFDTRYKGVELFHVTPHQLNGRWEGGRSRLFRTREMP